MTCALPLLPHPFNVVTMNHHAGPVFSNPITKASQHEFVLLVVGTPLSIGTDINQTYYQDTSWLRDPTMALVIEI
jgi:hypothetical protein